MDRSTRQDRELEGRSKFLQRKSEIQKEGDYLSGKGYFVVHEWMVTDLGLKGTELLVYAIIFGFTQIEEQSFFGSRKYLADFSGASLRAVQYALDSLVDKGLLSKHVTTIPCNNTRTISYKSVLHPQCKNFTGAKIAHNNIHNSFSSKGVTVSKEGSSNRFTKPTADEIRAYCREKGYSIDPEAFLDYYESKGWLIGKTPMKDWKAAVRTWVRNSKKSSVPTQ